MVNERISRRIFQSHGAFGVCYPIKSNDMELIEAIFRRHPGRVYGFGSSVSLHCNGCACSAVGGTESFEAFAKDLDALPQVAGLGSSTDTIPEDASGPCQLEASSSDPIQHIALDRFKLEVGANYKHKGDDKHKGLMIFVVHVSWFYV